MLGRFNLLVNASLFCSAMLVASAALAQDDDPYKDEPAEDEGESEAGTDAEPEEEDAAQDDEEAEPKPAEKAPAAKEQDQDVQAAYAADSPVELPGKTYYFLGLRYRGIIVPKFMMNLFGDGGTTVWVDAVGPEFGIRKDGFEYDFSLWWADYGMEETPFKASDDPITAWEIVESKINVLYLTADFMWSHDFAPEFALNYGMGAGFGIVWGKLYRTQATPPPSNPFTNDPYDWVKCPYQGYGNFCGTDNDHYNGYTEPSWANDGSKPVLYPWFVLQTGFRIKPHRNFVGRIDMGFGTSGFFVGVGADYGL